VEKAPASREKGNPARWQSIRGERGVIVDLKKKRSRSHVAKKSHLPRPKGTRKLLYNNMRRRKKKNGRILGGRGNILLQRKEKEYLEKKKKTDLYLPLDADRGKRELFYLEESLFPRKENSMRKRKESGKRKKKS